MSFKKQIAENARQQSRRAAAAVQETAAKNRVSIASDTWPAPQPLPDDLPSVLPFDFDLLPTTLRPWIEDIAERLQCPPDFPAVAAMVALAGIVGRKVGIRPKRQDDWLVVPNLWGMVIGRPSLLKTPAIQEPLKPIKRLEVEAKKLFESAEHEFVANKAVSEAKAKLTKDGIKAALKDGKDAAKVALALIQDAPDEPVRRRYLTNDIAKDEKRRSIRLGKIPLRLVREIRTKVEALNAAATTRHSLDGETARWVADLNQSPVLAEKLAAVGLIPRREFHACDLGEFVDSYIASRVDAKPNTLKIWKQTATLLKEFFGEKRSLQSITKADAKDWRMFLIKRDFAEASIRKHCGFAKHFVKQAVDRELLSKNSFSDLISASIGNPDRQYFVTREKIQKSSTPAQTPNGGCWWR